jgi:hypothetical protein
MLSKHFATDLHPRPIRIIYQGLFMQTDLGAISSDKGDSLPVGTE